MTPRTSLPGYGATLFVGLLSALAVTVGAARPWVSAQADVPGLPTVSATVAGADLVPAVGALGVVLLAAFGAVIATGGRVRRAVGALIVVISLVVVVVSTAPGDSASQIEDGLAAKGWPGGPYDSHIVWWRWLVLIGAVGCGLAGASVVSRGGRWATMGARYDAPSSHRQDAPGSAREEAPGSMRPDGPAAQAGELSESDAWKAIDSGRDPTQGP